MPEPQPSALKILVVCTANICRSPMSAGFLKAGAKSVGLRVRIASAGFLEGGIAADPHVVEVMGERGIDLSRHRSHQIRPIDIEAADLILTMERAHLREIVALTMNALGRTFTLVELEHLGRAIGPRKAGEQVSDWLERLSVSRNVGELMDSGTSHDIEDPYGGPRRGFERTAEDLDRRCWAILDLLAGYIPAP